MSKPVSVWTFKPWWCQPWSIVLTSILVISGCSWLTRTAWITVLVAVPVVVWMVYFLWIYPQLMAQSGLLEQFASQSGQSLNASDANE